MSELEAEWARRLAEAEQSARARGRSDVADYLALRALNDMARNTGIEWLLAAFTTHAGECNRAGAGIRLAHTEAHRFRVGASTMVGQRLTLTTGVRVLTVEAGWPRTPRDGIVRGGGLAAGRITHFGNPSANDELLLMQNAGDAPRWMALDPAGVRPTLEASRVRRHIEKLLG
ncbi:MAG TPA: hypothetical protein VEZ40_12615 [Pyrinomonadaceae bacterium]|nr:hypothetical protein [Pyrinomonadaceae bacterium]